MSMTFKKLLMIVGGFAVVAVLALVVADRLARSHRSSDNASDSRDSRPHLKWKLNTDNNSAVASIVLGRDGTVYIGANNGIYAAAPDGTRLWKQRTAGFAYLAEAEDGTLYVSGGRGLIFGYLPNGTLSWDPRQGLIGFGAPPAIGRNGYVLFANITSDLFAFRPGASQQPDWSRSTFRGGLVSETAYLPGEALVNGPQSRNSPAIWRDETLALPRQHWMHVFDADGTQAWFTELTPGQLGPAALADDGTIYVADDRGTFFAVRHSGDVLWTAKPDGGLLGSAVVGGDNTIYFATPNSVNALAPDGTPKWQTKTPFQGTTGLAIADDGTLYAAGTQGMFAMRSDGSLKWTLHTMSGTGAPAIAPDGTIYFPCGYMWVCAVEDQGSPLAKSPWPKMYHDNANTSRILTTF
jgi:outer membrane protein assembly factor BamB